jgi:hypothetical protein
MMCTWGFDMQLALHIGLKSLCGLIVRRQWDVLGGQDLNCEIERFVRNRVLLPFRLVFQRSKTCLLTAVA